MKQVELTKGQVALVDDQDFEEISKFNWCATWTKSTKSFYAVRGVSIGNGKSVLECMHRRILKLEHGDKRRSDHINHDTLDNRRVNLRIATATESNRNLRKRSDNISGYKGVSWNTRRGKWLVQIGINGKRKSLGYFQDAVEAHKVYETAARKYFREFAYLGT